MPVRFVSLAAVLLIFVARAVCAADWSEEQVSKLPSGEAAVRLFNGHDLAGWEGHFGKYFTVENGIIVGKTGLGCLSTPMTDAEVDTFLAALERSLAAVHQA